MIATKLDGTLYRDEIFADLVQRVAALKDNGITPGLATVLVGEDPGSQSYVKMKHRDCEALGINSIRRDLPGDISQEELLAVIDELNEDLNPDKSYPFYPASAINGDGVFETLKAITKTTLKKLRKRMASPQQEASPAPRIIKAPQPSTPKKPGVISASTLAEAAKEAVQGIAR